MERGVSSRRRTTAGIVAALSPKRHARRNPTSFHHSRAESSRTPASRIPPDARRFDRCSVLGLTKPDILDYLPVSDFVPASQSWDELRAQHSALGPKHKFKKNFKGWLTEAHSADFSDANIRSAAESLDSIPAEFTEILNLCDKRSDTTDTPNAP